MHHSLNRTSRSVGKLVPLCLNPVLDEKIEAMLRFERRGSLDLPPPGRDLSLLSITHLL